MAWVILDRALRLQSAIETRLVHGRSPSIGAKDPHFAAPALEAHRYGERERCFGDGEPVAAG
ncbi:MAG: hypothetical protein L0210_07000 [Rhodospirillales bacterium]|nr:hypothetical protein [Rhodospirillales bacterium]